MRFRFKFARCDSWRMLAFAGMVAILTAVLAPTTVASAAYDYDGVAGPRVDAVDSLVVRVARPTAPSVDETITLRRARVSERDSSLLLRSRFATNTADDAIAGIKPGSAGGPTAGKAFPQSVREAALAENPSTCVYCHVEAGAPQVDHAIPRVQGGNATIENAQTTCAWCNASKGGRSVPVNPPPGYVGPWPPSW